MPGDPSLLAHEWKTGVTDLVSKTSTEVKAGGAEGAGKGFLSFLHHAVGKASVKRENFA